MQIVGTFPLRRNFYHYWRDYYSRFFCLTRGKKAHLIEYEERGHWLLPEPLKFLFSSHTIIHDKVKATRLPIPSPKDLEGLRKFILRNYGIKEQQPDKIIVIRRQTHRELSNSEELIAALGQNVEHVTFENYPFREQLNILQRATHLIGYHGAGITQGLFTPPGCKVIEIAVPGQEYAGFKRVLLHRQYVRLPSTPGKQVVPLVKGKPELNICGNVDIEDVLRCVY